MFFAAMLLLCTLFTGSQQRSGVEQKFFSNSLVNDERRGARGGNRNQLEPVRVPSV
jgi:hypothetical protein